MAILSILKQSLGLLWKEPKIFIPKLITTSLYTAVMIFLAGIASQMAEATNYFSGGALSPPDPSVVEGLLADLAIVLVSTLFLLLADLISYAMYPALIRDHNEKRPISLSGALKEAFGAWRILATIGAAVILFAIVGGIFMVPFEVMTIRTGNVSFYLFAALVMLAAALSLLVILFFVVPVGVVEKKGVVDAFRHGFSLSMRHKKDLFAINVFFLILTSATFAILVVAESQGYGMMEASSIALFVLVRVVQAVMYTYISVVNPYFYIAVR